jgi:hypothetical protein
MTHLKLLVDGHVHFHACFTWRAFLDAAVANFADARRALRLSADSPGCLMLTESAGVNYYRTLLAAPAPASSLGWNVEKCDDHCSIVLRRASETLVVVAGRQVVTAENLEVLALGSTRELPLRRPLRDILRAVADSGALAVIPWGFGKWWGRRGRIVRDLIESRHDVPFCLGDNGGRTHTMRRPTMFERAERRGMLVLGGSDPLAMPAQVTRAGGYGFVLDDWRATSRPWPAIVTRIQALQHSPPVFGELSSLSASIRSQLGVRWHRRGSNRRSREAAIA